MDWPLAVAGLVTGLLVGLTGTGGGALMTPILTLIFGVPPLAAVSTDLVTGVFMKPVAVAVHLPRHTIRWRIAGWLCAGSVPAAFAGAVVDGLLGSAGIEQVLKLALGATLLVAVASTVVRMYLDLRRGPQLDTEPEISAVRLAIVGAVVGFVVGMTSVGSGSLVMVTLLLMYPGLSAGRLVGTDLAQALPLIASAALGHLLFGQVQFAMVFALLVGAIPGAIAGALLSSRAPSRIIRAALAVVLLSSGLSLLGAPALVTVAVAVVATGGAVGWLVLAWKSTPTKERDLV
ncbi:sulfite exporter TauE/SafE family protein [Fodinicola acaciae]|uniref:sulfite exporter TauE/SafE family protein n=1 Tax=Fodinicola acaciae TaxID=2681555 RepID=UPI0013D61ACC|nr:sulfite exporter TauE/SafE family protein [Fodinicola acaciae]